MSLEGKKVKVTFAESWPIDHATYTYEGADETGYWLRRKDGKQRHMLREDVVNIELAESEISEPDF